MQINQNPDITKDGLPELWEDRSRVLMRKNTNARIRILYGEWHTRGEPGWVEPEKYKLQIINVKSKKEVWVEEDARSMDIKAFIRAPAPGGLRRRVHARMYDVNSERHTHARARLYWSGPEKRLKACPHTYNGIMMFLERKARDSKAWSKAYYIQNKERLKEYRNRPDVKERDKERRNSPVAKRKKQKYDRLYRERLKREKAKAGNMRLP